MSLSSEHIPQADSLARVLDFLAQLERGDLLEATNLGITSRQRSYYLKAARILGLTDEHDALREAGIAVLALPERARMARLALAFEASPCGQAWCAFAGAVDLRGVNPDSAYAFLSTRSELSLSSSKRRAQTLKRWLKDFHRHHPSGAPTFEPGRETFEAGPSLASHQEGLFAGEGREDEDQRKGEDEAPRGGAGDGGGASPRGGDEGLSLEVDNDLEHDISRRLRTLLRTAPLLRLEQSKSHRSLDLSCYDLRSISLRVFDQVIAHMGMGSGLTRSQLHWEMADTLRQMAPDAERDEHGEVLDLVIDGLLNDRDRRQAFKESWISLEGGAAVERILRFHLLREEETSEGEIVLRATHEGINIYAGMLDTDVEDAQTAEEAILKSQLRRGRFQQALGTARRALQRSIEYEQKLSLHLDTTRRDVSQVDWVQEVLGLLEDARSHIKERLEVERDLVTDIERRLDVLAGTANGLRLAELRDTLQQCLERHIRLQGRVGAANKTWLDEQERQRFRPAMISPLPDPEADILRPALTLPMATLADRLGELLRWHNSPRPPHLLYMPHLIAKLLRPRRRQSEEVEPPGEPHLEAQVLAERRFPPEVIEDVESLLAGVTSASLSEVLEVARDQGMGLLGRRLLVLMSLRAFDDSEGSSSLRVHSKGEPLRDLDFAGDDLQLVSKEGVSN